jgi:hypothetical protein
LECPECQEGLRTRWNLTIDSSGRITGLQQHLEAFEKYVNSLKGKDD